MWGHAVWSGLYFLYLNFIPWNVEDDEILGNNLSDRKKFSLSNEKEMEGKASSDT